MHMEIKALFTEAWRRFMQFVNTIKFDVVESAKIFFSNALHRRTSDTVGKVKFCNPHGCYEYLRRAVNLNQLHPQGLKVQSHGDGS